MSPTRTARRPVPPAGRLQRHGVARVLSKLGQASRTQAAAWVRAGEVQVNGRLVLDPEFPVRPGIDLVEVSGRRVAAAERLVLMLNKPRGLVTTARDERGRGTVYECLDGASLPWLAPVGRLDKASEGLLLFSNDPEWAGRITDPATGPEKAYHVQIDRQPVPQWLEHMCRGVMVDGERLASKSARLLRAGEKHAWLEVVLDEGRNRQLRRMLGHFGVGVLRLVRVRIGSLALGSLPKGRWRRLTAGEIAAL